MAKMRFILFILHIFYFVKRSCFPALAIAVVPLEIRLNPVKSNIIRVCALFG